MSRDTVTEKISKSWWQRLKASLAGFLFGLILFLVAFPLLFWNEGQTVHSNHALQEGMDIVISVDAKKIDSANEGKLVHVSSHVTSDDTLADETFGVVVGKAIKLRRTIKMFQWQETSHSTTKEKMGGGTETTVTYSYSKVWSDKHINSNTFKQVQGHENPALIPFSSKLFQADNVKVGTFLLSSNFINQLDHFQPVTITTDMLEQASVGLRQKLQIYDKHFYIGEIPTNPQVGDLQVIFEVAQPTSISVIAKQSGSSLIPYLTQAGEDIELLEYGIVNASTMFQHKSAINATLTWSIRLGGFVVMFIGLTLMLNVLRTLAAVLPVLADIVGFMNTFVSATLAGVFSLSTIAIAWVVYRPILGISLLAIAIVLLLSLKFMHQENEEE